MAKAKVSDIVAAIQSSTDEAALTLEAKEVVETTGDHALDPAEEVTDGVDS